MQPFIGLLVHRSLPISQICGRCACILLLASALLAQKPLPSPVQGGSSGGGGATASTDLSDSATLQRTTSPLTERYTAGVGGVTLNRLVKLDTDGTVVAVTGTEGILGIAQATVSQSATVNIVLMGPASCVAEGVITAGHYLIAGTVDPTMCKDSGQTALTAIPLATRIIAKASAAAVDAATVAVVAIGAFRFGSQTLASAVVAGAFGTGAYTIPTGGSLDVSGTGTINATSLGGSAAALYATLASPTFTTGVTLSSAPLTISGNISAAAWTTGGLRIKGVSGTLTDTTSSGTVAAAYTDVLGGNTIAASSATVFTKYYSAYFKDPVVGTNVTLTRAYALGADSLGVGAGTVGAPSLTLSDPTTGFYAKTANVVTLSVSGAAVNNFASTNMQAASTWSLAWSSGGIGSATDVMLSRDSAGVLQINSGTAGAFRALKLSSATFFDNLATTGATRVVISKGAADTTITDTLSTDAGIGLTAIGMDLMQDTSGGNGFRIGTSGSGAFKVYATTGNGIRILNTTPFGWSSTTVDSALDTIISRAAAASFRHGATDAAAPVAQTITVQSVLAGTSNTAGANWTFAGSKGTGTGVGGSILFQTAPAGSTGTSQNAVATILSLGGDAAATFTGVIQSGGYKSSDGTAGVTVTTCTGFKNGLCISGT